MTALVCSLFFVIAAVQIQLGIFPLRQIVDSILYYTPGTI